MSFWNNTDASGETDKWSSWTMSPKKPAPTIAECLSRFAVTTSAFAVMGFMVF